MNTLNNVLSTQFLKEEINNLYTYGMPEGYKLGIQSIDSLFRLDTAMVSVITGVPNYGKSEFLDYICIRLNKKYALKTLYFSPENFPIRLHLSKLLRKLTNKSFNDLTKEEIDTNINYIANNFYFLNYETVSTLDDILNEAERLIIEKDVKILNIDPFNTLEDKRPNNLTETEYVSQVMTRLQKFTKKHNILINLVVHPKKLQNDINGDTVIPGRYDLNGSANFANKADYIIIVHRDFINNTTIIKCDKCKFSNYGTIGECEIQYDTVSTNYFDIDSNDKEATKEDDIYMTALQVYEQTKIEEEKKNVLDVNVSYFEHIYDKKGTTINLYDYLTDTDKKYYNRYSQSIKRIQKAAEENDKECKQELKRNLLGGVTISCITQNDKSDIKEINNLICIDIDEADNSSLIMQKVPSALKSLSCVAYASKSASGKGYYCIIPIKHTDKFKEHFYALERDFANMNIVIDTACKNVNRFRYYSIPCDCYINTNAETYTSLAEETKKITTNTNTDNKETKSIDINDKSIAEMVSYIDKNKLDITNTYTRWLSVTAAIANTYQEAGRTLYHSICKHYKAYNRYECDSKYSDLLVNSLSDISIATLFYIFNERKGEYEEKHKAL